MITKGFASPYIKKSVGKPSQLTFYYNIQFQGHFYLLFFQTVLLVWSAACTWN